MDKYAKYNPDEEAIEAWLKGFEIRLLCHNISDADRKRNWCRSLVGEAGNSIIEKLPQAATWAEVKEELCSVLGEGNPKKRAFDVLQNYKPKGKGLGEMATDIMAKASLATSDADLQVQLGLKAFLQAVPRNIGRELRRRHFVSVKEALKEARFLQSVIEEDEDHESGEVFKGKEEVKPVKEPKVDLNRVVEACIRKLQTLQACKKQSERPGYARKRRRCWCCGQKGHLVRACPLVQRNQKAEKRLPESAKGCQRVHESAKGCQMAQESARRCQRVPDGARGCQMVQESARGYQRMPDGTRGCQMVSEGARGYQIMEKSARGCQRMPDGAKGCQMVSDGSKGCQMVQESTRECQNGPDGANGCQMVPEGGKRCQKDQVGPVVAPGLGKKTDLIFVTVSIAGVEVVALVDTGATTSCCRWEWYQQWKDHLGAVTKSKIRVMGIAPDPVKVKGLTKPLTLLWDGVGGRFQLAVLPTLHDVDVVLGVDVLSQLNVQFDWVRQVVSPYREPCIQVESGRSIGLLLENPDSTFKGKIPVKEEGVKEVAKDMLRPAYQNLRYCYKAREKKEDRKIVWNQADYRVKLQEDLKDIRKKLCQVSGKELAKKEETRPVNRMEEGVLVDLCEQRSCERGSGCYAPEEIYKSNKLANVVYNSSEGLSTPVTSSLMPPKPARTERRNYFWRNSSKREVCMYVRILDPLEFRNNYKKESDDKFNEECSEGGKDVTSSSHSNRKSSKNSKSMTVSNSGKNGINSYNNKYREIKIKNNSASKGRQGEERDETLRLPDIIKREGKMTSLLHNTVAQEQQQSTSLAGRVAKQCKSRHIRSRSSGSLRFRKAVQSYDKIAAILFMCFGIIMQLSEAFSHFARCKSKRLIGNSRIGSVDGGVWRWCMFVVCFLFECRTSLWKFRHRIWPKIILEGLWIGNNVINKIDKRCYQLTFRLVLATCWLRNLLHGNVCSTNVAIGIGNADDARDANNVCLCLYSDLWASCHMYLCRDMEILGLLYKIGSFRIFIYLYRGKIRSLWLSCEQASFFLAFPNKLCTLVYFVSKDCLLDRISRKKYQCTNLVGLAPLEKAYTGIKPFFLGLRRVVTSGDPLDMAYKRGH